MLLKMYEQMYLIRFFENTLEELFKKGLLVGTIHSCAGQEAAAVGVVNALSDGDIITGHHRSHGHFLSYTDDVKGLMAEIMGRSCGVVGGRGGSQHLCKGNFYSNGVQGGMVPVAAGMAFTEKKINSGNIVISFMGDGTLGQGVVYESMNMASLWNLPVIYVVENNRYAMSTRVEDAVAGRIIDRGRAFGIESSEVTSNNVEVIYKQAVDITSKVRKDSRPYLWIINTYRLSGHSKSDDRSYRSREEEEEQAKSDPLLITGKKIRREVLEQIEEKCRRRIEEAIRKIQDMDFPSKGELIDSEFRGFGTEISCTV